jgi:integrase
MPKLSPRTIVLIKGKLLLYPRKRSTKWQTRYKCGGQWIRDSTEKEDVNEAEEVARDLYADARFRLKHGIPAQSKRFKDVAKLAVDRMQKAIAAGEGRRVYRDYIQVINKYFIPFFGRHNIHSIDYPLVQRFSAWRVEQMRKSPKASTINTHNSALSRIFDEALMRGYIAKTQIPILENKGRDAQRRPDFTLEEYQTMYRALRTWINEGRDGKSREMRELLRDYVLILANTGIRHGTEAQNLKWKNVSEFVGDDGNKYLAMWVRGKTGEREIVARHSCVRYLKRIHQRCADIAHVSFEELLRTRLDTPVFRLRDGTVSNNLHQTFRAFMNHCGLLVDPNTGRKRTLYSLRHMYATFRIVYGNVNLHVLARQMGTSIAMLEQHYSHLIPRQRAAELAGRRAA